MMAVRLGCCLAAQQCSRNALLAGGHGFVRPAFHVDTLHINQAGYEALGRELGDWGLRFEAVQLRPHNHLSCGRVWRKVLRLHHGHRMNSVSDMPKRAEAR